MRIPIGWLREFADLPESSEELAERLAMLGFPVAEIARRPKIEKVVVGRIVALERHPNADRLQVCTVDVGAARALTIITAATNVSSDQHVPVATIGARLPQITIERRSMRGLESEGMLCSPDELALPPEWFEHDGIMQLDGALPVGADPVAALGLADDVLDVEITSNRPDAMCAVGLARELAASYRVPLRSLSSENPGRERATPEPRIAIETEDCRRFVAQRLDAPNHCDSPVQVRVRLALCGVRPINLLVDVSNYVMLETGQPLHFYDTARIAGAELIVRDARAGEELVTLDGVARTLSPVAMVIADERGAVGLAGVMGGESSEVRDSTTTVLLEAANFSGARVRRTAALAGLRTEASSRHERILSPALTDLGAARAAQLIVGLGGKAYAPVVAGEMPKFAAISLSTDEVERVLGMRVGAERIAEHLTALGCACERRAETVSVSPPSWRCDLTIAADLVEEVARMEGYDRIEPVMPAVLPHDLQSTEFERERDAAQTLRALGYHETIGLSLQDAGDDRAVAVKNPLSEQQRYLRTSLRQGLLESLLRARKPYRLFEIGHEFSREGDLIAETSLLGLAFSVAEENESTWHDAGFLRLHGDAAEVVRALCGRSPRIDSIPVPGLHPGKSAALSVDDAEVATLGRVDPHLERALESPYALYLCSVRLDRLPPYRVPKYRVPSRFPSTYRDLSLSLDAATRAADVETVTARAIGDACSNVHVFDEYRGPQAGAGRKSLTVRVTMRRYDATLTDEEADAAMARAVRALAHEIGAAVRS